MHSEALFSFQKKPHSPVNDLGFPGDAVGPETGARKHENNKSLEHLPGPEGNKGSENEGQRCVGMWGKEKEGAVLRGKDTNRKSFHYRHHSLGKEAVPQNSPC